jgi:diguanylate cyclase (GGDEF)-like protein
MAKIVAAEDDLENQELIKFTLENEVHQVSIASDGEEALKKVLEEKPDLIMLDIMMPKFTGFEVCERLRNNPETCPIPIIILTSLSQAKDRITGIKLGADEYLCKPFEPLELTARIEALLRRAQQDSSSSPLTKLPGSTALQKELEKRMGAGEKFALLYIDLNNFKCYNEAYGFERGDGMIRFMAALLRSSLSGAEGAFLCHVGGDDFAVIASAGDAEKLADRIVKTFDNVIAKQYDEETVKRGYMLAVDKTGAQSPKPLMKISVGIALAEPGTFRHYSEVIEQAKEKWKSAKMKTSSGYAV